MKFLKKIHTKQITKCLFNEIEMYQFISLVCKHKILMYA